MLSKVTESNVLKSIPQRLLSTSASAASSSSTTNPASLRSFDSIPGPQSVPKYGTGPEFVKRIESAKGDIFKAVNTYYAQYGPHVRQEMRGKKEVWVFHPQHHLEVLRQEGQYPMTALLDLWPLEKYFQIKGIERPASLTATQGWQTWRRAIQKDMFSPAAAESYLPLLDDTVKLISQQIVKVKRVSEITNYAAMDMFFSIMLGHNPRTVLGINGNPNKEVKDEDIAFGEDAVESISGMVKMLRNPFLDAENPGDTFDAWTKVQDRVSASCRRYTQQMIDHYHKNSTTEGVRPYLMRLLDRNELTENEVLNQFSGLLNAGVDTTHHILMWLLLNLGRYPEHQAKVREEVFRVVGDGPLEAEHLRSLPYLNQVMRESHRVSPPSPLTMTRTLPADGHMNGYFIPKNTRVTFGSHCIQMDSKYVEDPEEFRPERWSPEAIEKRKGTEKESIDHKLCAEPFGFGPRMCIGGRVAKVELKALITRLVRDWSWEWEPKEQTYKISFGTFSYADPFPTFKWQSVSKP